MASLLVACTPGMSLGADALPVVSTEPALAGASFTVAGTLPYAYIPVGVRLPAPDASSYYLGFSAEVSDRNVPGQDGSLADDYIVGRGTFSRSDADPSVWRGVVQGQFMLRPGTYYLQLSARRYLSTVDFTLPCAFGCLELSPVYTIQTIAPAPVSPPITPSPTGGAASEQCRQARAQLVVAQRKVALQRGVVSRAKTKAARTRAVKKLRAAAVARNRVQAAMWRACP